MILNKIKNSIFVLNNKITVLILLKIFYIGYIIFIKYVRMTKFISISFCLLSALILISCSEVTGPEDSNSSYILKSETKWLTDNHSEVKIAKISHKEYDYDGNITLIESYNEKGLRTAISNFKYGNKLRNEETTFYNIDGTVDSTQISTTLMRADGNILEKIYFNQNGDTVTILDYDYDDHGNLTKYIMKLPNGDIQSITYYEYKFNHKGNVVERIINPTETGSYQTKDSLSYHLDDHTVIRKQMDSNGDIKMIYTYIYNYKGLISKEIITNSHNDILEKYVYEYNYY